MKSIKEHLDCNTTLYADLPGVRNPVATIPEDTLVISARPDIVLMGEDEVTLTIPHNSLESRSNARNVDRKSQKGIYLHSLSDVEAKGLTSHLYTIEIGSLRHWLPTSQRAMLKAAPSLMKQSTRKTMDEAPRKVIGAFQVIFKARLKKVWTPSHTLL